MWRTCLSAPQCFCFDVTEFPTACLAILGLPSAITVVATRCRDDVR